MTVRCEVHAWQRWNDSGLEVREGDCVDIRATGKWIDWWVPAGPEGFEKGLLKPLNWARRVRRAHWFELVAVVGKNNGPYWRFTERELLVATRSGRVYLFANDARPMYWNNKGFLDVELDLLS